MHVLELLHDTPTLSLTEIARALEVVPSTAHRLLWTLAHRDLATQDPETKAWTIGSGLLRIGLAAAARLDIRQTARPELEKLAASLNETVHLTQLEGMNVLFLDTVESTRAVRVTDRSGVLLPAYSTASGKVLLAQIDRSVLYELLPERLQAVTELTLTSRRALERELETVRRRGYAVNVGGSERGLTAIAAAIPAPELSVPMSLCASLPTEHLTAKEVKRISPHVMAAAARIGQLLQSDASRAGSAR
jgi:IclR family transcriptional regulator, acetate operon repressor